MCPGLFGSISYVPTPAIVTLLAATVQFGTPAVQDKTIELLTNVIAGSNVVSPGSRSIVWVAPLIPEVVSGSAIGAGGGATVGV